MKVLFAVLSMHEREGWVHPSILQFFCDLPFASGLAYRMIPVHNFKPAAAGRNVFCKQAKDSDTDWLCMIDNDMVLPDNLLDTIKNAPADADIVCPFFYSWNQGELAATLCWGVDNPDGHVFNFRPGYHQLTKCGTGVIFIKPHVFQSLPYPFFTYLYNDDGCLYGSEDIQFCQKAREKGFKIYGYTEVKVGHYHSIEIGSLWRWKDKVDVQTAGKIDLTPIPLDADKSFVVEDGHQDAGRSSARVAAESVPLAAD